VLREVKGPLAVVAVCGRSRQGKSFILNQIASSSGQGAAKANAGFEVAATHKPCTKVPLGLSLAAPRETASPRGQPAAVGARDAACWRV
jgi:hypothetical protein